MSTETTPYSPSVAQKLGADCEKLRLVYWLYNNDDNGCGPVQGMPLTFYGSYTMDEFYCDGINVLSAPVPISYTNFNGNFNEWTGTLNPLTPHHWDWINAGPPCWRVMSTITCDDTVYGDYLLTAVDVVVPKYNGAKILIQPQAIVGPEVEVLICREISKSGETSKTIYTKSGDVIDDLGAYYAEQADHLIVSDTGTFPFTAANIAKFYTEDELCECLKSCDHIYDDIDESAPCNVQFQEGGCVYVKDEDGNFILPDGSVSEAPGAYAEGVSQSVLFGLDGSIKAREVVEGQFQEDESNNVVLYSSYEEADSTLPDGWYYDQTCTGTEPAPPNPPPCPDNVKLDLGCIHEFGAFADNSRWVGAPAVNMTGAWTVRALCDDGTELTASGSSWWPIRDVLNAAGYETNVACANWANCVPSGWPSWMPDPDIDTMFARGWFGVGCKKKIVKLTVEDHGDPAWIGAYKDIINVDNPTPQKIWYANICGQIYAEDCDGNPIFVEKCCVSECKATKSTESDIFAPYKEVKSSGISDANYDGAIAITRGRPDNTVEWALVDNRFPPNDGSVRPIVGATFQEFVAEAEAQGYSEFIIGEIHYLCPCPPGLEQAGDYFVTAGGQTQTKPACTPLTELEGSPDKEASEEECALRTAPCPSDVDIAALECLKDIKLLLTCCPRLDIGGATYTTGDNTGSLVQFPVTAGNPTLDYTVPLSIGEHECLSPDDVLRVRWCFEHELDKSSTHIGFNVLPVAAGTLVETSNGAGGVGNPNIGPAVPHNGPRTKQWADFEFTVAELQTGVAVQTCAFGTTDTLTETIHNQSFEIITDLAAMGCCA